MPEFHPVTMKDRAWMEPLLLGSGMRGSEYTFSNCFIYREPYRIRVARAGDMALISAARTPEELSYLFPAGQGNMGEALEECMADAKKSGQPFRMHGVPEEQAQRLTELYPGRFGLTPSRPTFDYLYETAQLASLSGKKLHAKRNFINRFLAQREGSWQFEPMGAENLEECGRMSDDWCRRNGCREDPALLEEQKAVHGFLRYFNDLGLSGGLLRVDGQVAAFTLGKQVSADTFVIHIEKAYADMAGAYPMINREFAVRELSAFRYVNREEDVGDEGLRRAKLSYRPAFLLEKYNAVSIAPKEGEA